MINDQLEDFQNEIKRLIEDLKNNEIEKKALESEIERLKKRKSSILAHSMSIFLAI